MKSLQPDPAKKRSKKITTKIDFEHFQKNFINEYSLLYFKISELEFELKARDKILQQQRTIIEKLENKNQLVDCCTQTDNDCVDCSVQTETCAVDTGVQTEGNIYCEYISPFNFIFLCFFVCYRFSSNSNSDRSSARIN